MDEERVRRLCAGCGLPEPKSIKRCAVGVANYVYIVECGEDKFVVRMNTEKNAYRDTVYWLEKLDGVGVPVPRIVAQGRDGELEFLVLSYIEGDDLGNVYSGLGTQEKCEIARQVVRYQRMCSQMHVDVPDDWSWHAFIRYMLDRAKERIEHNGIFAVEKVERLYREADKLRTYFDGIRPVAYLDDISSKNLIIRNGRVSGIIDVDWIGIGDILTFAALTKMALISLDLDTDYVDFVLDELQPDDTQRQAFLFYTLMYCVDFMGERGMKFTDKEIPADEATVHKYNHVYDELIGEWFSKYGQ